MRIYIAEDDAASRRLITTTLESFGHQCEVFEDGRQAWDAYRHAPAQVIVSDWMMPVMDGLALARRVREFNYMEYTYFIMITANANTRANYQAAIDAGVDDFLTKPLDRDAIWSRLLVAERILGFTTRIQELERILPICSYCKKVRDDNNYWEQVESYVTKTTGHLFSHSICPSCYDDVVKPEISAVSGSKNSEKR